MKKYVITILIILIVSTCTVGFAIPERIGYSINGMAGYNQDDYNVVSEKLTDTINIKLDMENYVNHDEVLYKNENVSLVMEQITFTGTGYNLRIRSKGHSNFNNGYIITLSNTKDKVIATKTGNLIFQLLGCDALIDDSMVYTFALYPENKIDTKKLINLKCDIDFGGLEIKKYIRK